MYVFNKITVTPQLPAKIAKLNEVASNLWWAWNTDFLNLFKRIDGDLWESVNKNPIKFLKLVSQERLEKASDDASFVKDYEKIINNFEDYMESKNTWFRKKYPESKNDLIAYFSAEYGLDQILPIYSGGLGILSGDHLKSSSDLGIPLVAVGLLYKQGFMHQRIDGYGNQREEYIENDWDKLPVYPVKDSEGNDLKIQVEMPLGTLFLKTWKINVGRINLYLLDSDLEENIPEYRGITSTLYGGNQETRIRQEIVLGMAGTNLLEKLGLKPTVYHMNEGHSAFLILELIKNIIKEKQVSFEMAKDIIASKTVFTTHTPVPAGNDIFPTSLIEKYFNGFWDKLGISKENFLKLGMKPEAEVKNSGFNMGILALKFSGRKNGVSKLHGEVSRELFSEVWPNIAANESPISYVTNGIHTCTWLAPNMKKLFNKYFKPYWQDDIQNDETWKKVYDIPDEELWNEHIHRKEKLIKLVKQNVSNRLKREGYRYDEINSIISGLNSDALTIGFSRRFATYKRATLIFKDLERITQILNNQGKPVQIIFAGKAHPNDGEGKDLIKFIHEISMKPQFKGKVFLLENYNMEISKLLVTGVDVWLNNPRRPMEASGTSGQKASVNGVINFSVLDGWWAEGYNQNNGWTIGTNAEYSSYEEQDRADSDSMYQTLENKIIPMYYDRDENKISKKWIQTMKNSIATTGGKYSTARMLIDYTNNFYMPLCNLYNKYYADLSTVGEFNEWKNNLILNWNNITIKQEKGNMDNITIDAGNKIKVKCKVHLPNISKDSIEAQVYYGQILENGVVDNIQIIPMTLISENEETKDYEYEATVELTSGGNYGYTFRVMPKSNMILDSANLNLIKWITK